MNRSAADCSSPEGSESVASHDSVREASQARAPCWDEGQMRVSQVFGVGHRRSVLGKARRRSRVRDVVK